MDGHWWRVLEAVLAWEKALLQETYNGFGGSRAFAGFRCLLTDWPRGFIGMAFEWLSDGFQMASWLSPRRAGTKFLREQQPIWRLPDSRFSGVLANDRAGMSPWSSQGCPLPNLKLEFSLV